MAMGEIYLTLWRRTAIRTPLLSGRYPSKRRVFLKWRGLECYTERTDISEAGTEDMSLVLSAPKADLIEIVTPEDHPNIYLSLYPVGVYFPGLQILHRLLPVPCGEVGKRLSTSELQQLKTRIPGDIYAEMLGARLRET
jgi:hypothetical protein